MSIIGNPLLLGGGSGSSYAFIIANYPSGATCTCSGATDSEDITSTQKLFHLPSNGTYTVTATDGTNISTQNVTITYKGQSTSIILTFWGYIGWCVAGGVDFSSYSSLSDVLANQVDVRTLMTKHASADYLYSWYQIDSTVLDTVMASTYGAKWLGLRDYVCDKFMANSTAKTTMLASSNWEYILKDKVPIMTSNTAPYGTASGTTPIKSGCDIFKAFDGDDSTEYALNTASTSAYIQYMFTNPINVRKVAFKETYAAALPTHTVRVAYSDDGTTWTNTEQTYNVTMGQINYFDIEDAGYHLYWKVIVTLSTAKSGIAQVVQFYGRSLDVSVPVMTSDTAPYGIVTCDSVWGGTTYPAWKAFDKNTSTQWVSADSTSPKTGWISYEFPSNITTKFLYAYINTGSVGDRTYTFSYYNEESAEWVDIGNIIVAKNKITSICVNADNIVAKKFRLSVTAPAISGTYSGGTVYEFNIFGLDYSERTNRTYIYDNGVIDADATLYKRNASDVAENTGSALHFYNVANSMASLYITKDITDKTLLRSKNKFYAFSFINKFDIFIGNHSPTTESGGDYTSEAYTSVNPSNSNLPNNTSLDISSFSGTHYIVVGHASGGICQSEFEEVWIE